MFDNGEEAEYDVVIFGTGYRHGLDELFEAGVWSETSTREYEYPECLKEVVNVALPTERAYAWPDLNGRGRSRAFDNLYFAGFDQGYLGGLTIGLYSYAIGEEVAVKLRKMRLDECEIPWVKNETMTEWSS